MYWYEKHICLTTQYLKPYKYIRNTSTVLHKHEKKKKRDILTIVNKSYKLSIKE